MALSLIYPLKKGTYRRVRGFSSHVKHNPGTWYGIDDGCPIGTPLIAMSGGRISHAARRTTGGGYSFMLNFTKYPGWSAWYAHCNVIPSNGKVFRQGQVIGKSGATGEVSRAHLHWSILHEFVPKNPDNPNVVKWIKEVEVTKKEARIKSFSDGYRAITNKIPTPLVINRFLGSGKSIPVYLRSVFFLRKLENVAKETADEYQVAINKLQKTIKGLQIDYTRARDHAVERNEELKACQKQLQGLTGVKKPSDEWSIVIFWRFLKDLFSGKI
jgi:hypothetical protein